MEMELIGWLLSIAIAIGTAIVAGLIWRRGKKTGQIVHQRRD